MKTLLIKLVCLSILTVNTAIKADEKTDIGQQPVEYNPRIFADKDRKTRIRTTAERVDEMFREYVQENNVPGFVYGVVLDDELVYSGSFGYANLEQEIVADEESLFRVASMSKSVTAIAILQLRDAGKLNLDDPIKRYLPEAGDPGYLTKDAPDITIRHLLTHSAGFPEDNPWGDRQLASPDEELMQLIEEGISFSDIPGLRFEYSNMGFALLGRIIQVVSGMSFEEYTTENILVPLGMQSTVWEFEKADQRKLAMGYAWTDGHYINVPLEHHGSFGPMGGLITSIKDYARYVSLHLSAWPARSDPEPGTLKRSSLREMHQPWRFIRHAPNANCPFVLFYAYGLNWAKICDGKTQLSHSGGLPGFGSNWVMLPELGLAVMSFDNRTYDSTGGLNRRVVNYIIREAGLESRVLPVSTVLQERKQALVEIIRNWDKAETSGLFAENFFMDNRLQDLKKRSDEIFGRVGRISGISGMKPENRLRGTFIMQGEKAGVEVFFTLSPEKIPLIQQLDMKIVEEDD